MGRRLTKAQFIEKSQAHHGTRYDYTHTHYQSTRIKVTIICPEHGPFRQRPDDHMAGRGCPGCSGNARIASSDFIRKAYKVHSGKYSYSHSKPRGNRSKVTIVCPKHGKFKQSVEGHLAGHGCPRCLTSRGEVKPRRGCVERGAFIGNQAVRVARKSFSVAFLLPVSLVRLEFTDFSHTHRKSSGALYSLTKTA